MNYVSVSFRHREGWTSTGIETDDYERDRRWLELLRALGGCIGVEVTWFRPEMSSGPKGSPK